jgi:hypothetical protein
VTAMRALRGGAMLSDYLESLVNEISNILTSFRHSIYEIVLYVLRKRHFKRHFCPSRARDARACRWQASGMMDSHLLVVSGVK